jgi:hypothetical protein
MRYTATLPHVYEWQPGIWAKEHCKSYLSSTAHWAINQAITVEYYFAEEKDLTMFLLRWS